MVPLRGSVLVVLHLGLAEQELDQEEQIVLEISDLFAY